jgi:hypothetical protein
MVLGYQGITLHGKNARIANDLLGYRVAYDTPNGDGTFVYRAGMDGAEVEIDHQDHGVVTYDFHDEVEAFVKGDYGDQLYVEETENDKLIAKEYHTPRKNGVMHVIRLVRTKATNDVSITVEVA